MSSLRTELLFPVCICLNCRLHVTDEAGLTSLAYMEMYMAIAYIVRRFELRLVDTTEKDMIWDDMVVPQFHGEFKVMTERRKE